MATLLHFVVVLAAPGNCYSEVTHGSSTLFIVSSSYKWPDHMNFKDDCKQRAECRLSADRQIIVDIKLSRLSHITTTHKVFSVQAPFNLAVFYNGKRITLFSFGYTLLAPICVR